MSSYSNVYRWLVAATRRPLELLKGLLTFKYPVTRNTVSYI